MCMSVCACMCVVTRVCVHTCVYTCICLHARVHVHVYMSACMCTPLCSICVCMCVFHAYVCVCVCMCVCMFIWGKCRCISNMCLKRPKIDNWMPSSATLHLYIMRHNLSLNRELADLASSASQLALRNPVFCLPRVLIASS